ncbi:putative membrane protein [Methylobacterium brachiatum]|uniref:Membrane protein n=1 Tax=Methylobacterium brachiatum TaxID=269660 RepID=A0AAJ1TMZ0_9HYPH|nr:DUF350 domain-containing protein [Methylobacterium brachiatum]MCB4803046.1 DUF350 domain-containing protein [Methylobacterium brachiatum]MDQ0543766.1 putative membrane protein [Methylobacterium brachiatum]
MISISGLPAFLLYVVTAGGLIGLYLLVYTLATAHNELALIRRDVAAAAVALGFSLVGFALPLAVAIYNAQSILDCIVWGLVALVVQILIYWLVRLAVPDLSQRIEDGRMAAAVLLGAASFAGGLVNAASMTA